MKQKKDFADNSKDNNKPIPETDYDVEEFERELMRDFMLDKHLHDMNCINISLHTFDDE